MSLVRTHTLASGLRVRIRLPQRGDAAGLVALHERLGRPVTPLGAQRLLRFDPRTRSVLCATAWIDGVETLVGYATAAPGEPSATVLADEERAPGLSAVLGSGLRERASGVA